MKLIRKNSQNADPAGKSSGFAVRPLPWKLLVVDDEPDVRALTLLNLRDFHFAGRGLQFIEAGSAAEALLQLALHPDISVALAGEAIPHCRRCRRIRCLGDTPPRQRTLDGRAGGCGNRQQLRHTLYDPEVVRALLRLHQRGELAGVNETR